MEAIRKMADGRTEVLVDDVGAGRIWCTLSAVTPDRLVVYGEDHDRRNGLQLDPDNEPLSTVAAESLEAINAMFGDSTWRADD